MPLTKLAARFISFASSAGEYSAKASKWGGERERRQDGLKARPLAEHLKPPACDVEAREMGTSASLVAKFLELDVASITKLQNRVVGGVVEQFDAEVLFCPSASEAEEPISEVPIRRCLKGAKHRQSPICPVVHHLRS